MDESEFEVWLQQALAIVFVALDLSDPDVLSQPGEIINPLWTVGRVNGLTLKGAWSRAGAERVLVCFLFLILLGVNPSLLNQMCWKSECFLYVFW